MSIIHIPTMFIILIFVVSLSLIFIGSIIKNIKHGKRKTAIIKVAAAAVVILGGKTLLNYSTFNDLPVPMASKYDSKYVINLNKVITSDSGTKVKVNKVFLDLKYVSFNLGVKGKDKLVAVELKKNPTEEKPISKMQGQWLGNRLSYQYSGFGMPYSDNEFVAPLYLVCYLSNGEELNFEIQDVNNIKSKTEFIKVNKTIENEGRNLTIESVTRALNYTNISAKSKGPFGEMDVSIINNDAESEKDNGSWSGGGSTYNYDFSFKPIQEGNITIKVTMKNSGKIYLIDVK